MLYIRSSDRGSYKEYIRSMRLAAPEEEPQMIPITITHARNFDIEHPVFEVSGSNNSQKPQLLDTWTPSGVGVVTSGLYNPGFRAKGFKCPKSRV